MLENLKQEKGVCCYLCKLLRRKGNSGSFWLVSIDFSEAVSGCILADRERICPEACFCDLGLFEYILMMDLWQKQ